MLQSFTGWCCLLLLFSCSSREDEQQAKAYKKHLAELVAADKAFAARSEKEGMKTAFLAYAAEEAVLLRPGYLPIAEDRVIRYLTAMEDTSFVMSWEPSGADVALSADLGYTYGTYTVTARDSVFKGTYLFVWKKQKDGAWKFVIDSGNAGAENEYDSF